eukprot:13907495-Ditylum_brightwellii.AAC.1
MECGPDRGYFPEATKLIHICDNKSQVGTARAAFKELGLEVKFQGGFRYVGGHIGSVAQREEWVGQQVEAWAEGVRRAVPGVGALMGPIEDALCQDFFPTLFGVLDPGKVEEKRALWGNSVKGSRTLPQNLRYLLRGAGQVHDGTPAAALWQPRGVREGGQLDCMKGQGTAGGEGAGKEVEGGVSLHRWEAEEREEDMSLAHCHAKQAERDRAERKGLQGQPEAD